MAKRKAHASPTKEFFVYTITKDVNLEDCILDLVDNCLDGARKVRQAQNPNIDHVPDYAGFKAEINFGATEFSIGDNCGGISISEAIDYAFHFGRRVDAPAEGNYSIGLYGIGMKRAIFKIGNNIDIFSSTTTEAFRATIDVKEWLSKPPIIMPNNVSAEDWDFDLEDAPVAEKPGTAISIRNLSTEVAKQFELATFENGLVRIIGRDYAQFLSKSRSRKKLIRLNRL